MSHDCLIWNCTVNKELCRLRIPNTFDGPVEVRTQENGDWSQIDLVNDLRGNRRGLGVHELVCAIREQAVSRIDGMVASHVLEACEELTRSAECEA